MKQNEKSGKTDPALRSLTPKFKLDELRKEIQLGINSGEPTPLDIQTIKARGRAKLAASQ